MIVMEKTIQIATDIFGHFERYRDEYLFTCPMCHHHKKKLSINFARNVFKCWVCEYAGKDVFFLIKKWGTYEQAKEYKAFIHHDNTLLNQLFFGTSQSTIVKRTTELPESYKFLLKGAPKYVFNQLKKREVSEEDIFKWKIGFCTTGRCADRIILPSFNLNGNCNYYCARSTLIEQNISYILPNDVEKHNIIFNELNVNWEKPIYLTEGVFDAIKLSQDNVIPIMGKTIGNNFLLLEKLIVYDPLVYLCLDTDNTKKGIINRSIKLAEKLISYGLSKVEIIDPWPYKDFGEIPKNKINDFLAKSERIENDFDLLEKELEQLEIRMECNE